LLKNYTPKGWETGGYEVVGEPPAAPYPGAGFEHKLWAGTVVKLPIEEARALIGNTREWIEIVGETHERVPRVEKYPLAERTDEIPF